MQHADVSLWANKTSKSISDIQHYLAAACLSEEKSPRGHSPLWEEEVVQKMPVWECSQVLGIDVGQGRVSELHPGSMCQLHALMAVPEPHVCMWACYRSGLRQWFLFISDPDKARRRTAARTGAHDGRLWSLVRIMLWIVRVIFHNDRLVHRHFQRELWHVPWNWRPHARGRGGSSGG